METLAARLRSARRNAGMSQAELAKLLEVGQSTIASIENGRNNGSRFLVRIAQALGVDPIWLETGAPPLFTPGGSGRFAPAGAVAAPPPNGHVLIRQFDTGGAMGNGVELRDQPGVIESWSVSKEWLHLNVRGYTSASNLCIVTGFGDSMRPMFNPGDPLIADRGVRAVEYDGVYFFRIGNEGFIKRLQRLPTENGLILRARSDNSAHYEPFDITPKMDFEVLARILKVWRSEEF